MAANSFRTCNFLLKQTSMLRQTFTCSYSTNLFKYIWKPSAALTCYSQPLPNSKVQECSFHTTSFVCGKQKKKKSWYRMYKRQPALTKLRLDQEPKVTTRKAFGGGHKQKALKVNSGTYTLKSQDIELKVPIKEVVWNDSNKDFTKKGIMVKGTVVTIDANPFKSCLEDKNFHLESLDQRVVQQLQEGKIYAKIMTRPGQVGVCNGDILEGEELDIFLSKQNSETQAAL